MYILFRSYYITIRKWKKKYFDKARGGYMPEPLVPPWQFDNCFLRVLIFVIFQFNLCTEHEKLVVVRNTHNYKIIISGPDIGDRGHVYNNVYPSRPTVIHVFPIHIKYYILPIYCPKIVNSVSIQCAPVQW